ncbi:lytic transglycosylase domain-containing protein [Vogesella sp. DC21W]|uniref:Lytic transglycosylase domain-containing protein n=1 Tax=Vogesella aquatica TaxID=2984206 RepID=A0ABT5IUJ9_9NEIS|nr:lytic transglycosylase domain-containing protein [Vogesella aquatica]MDC7716214.1 lytic transglycosylase domain-containing protein [Vogesella aquatica]
MTIRPILAGLIAFATLPAAWADSWSDIQTDHALGLYRELDDAIAPGLGTKLNPEAVPPFRKPPAVKAIKALDIPVVKAPSVDARQAATFNKLIAKVAREQKVDPQLLHAIIAVESGYDPEALSPKGAQGLMQLMPQTAARFGASNPADPLDNLRAGARYVRFLLTAFKHDMPLVIAAYNAGEGSVSKYRNSIPPYPETRMYVAKVLASYEKRTGQSLLLASTATATVGGRVRVTFPADTPL